jgi:hypothetical protein
LNFLALACDYDGTLATASVFGSGWLVKNEELADEVRDVESKELSAEATKRRVIEAIQSRYTLSG